MEIIHINDERLDAYNIHDWHSRHCDYWSNVVKASIDEVCEKIIAAIASLPKTENNERFLEMTPARVWNAATSSIPYVERLMSFTDDNTAEVYCLDMFNTPPSQLHHLQALINGWGRRIIADALAESMIP